VFISYLYAYICESQIYFILYMSVTYWTWGCAHKRSG